MDPFLVAIVVLELLNFALLAWVVRWTVRAGRNVIQGVLKSLHLRRGNEESPVSQLSGIVGALSGKGTGNERGESSPGTEGLDWDALGERFGVSGEVAKQFAAQFLGPAGSGGGSKPDLANVIAAVATGKVAPGDAAGVVLPQILRALMTPGSGRSGGPGRPGGGGGDWA